MGVGEMKDLKINKGLIKNVLVKETENLPDDFTFDIIDNYIIFADDGECQFEVNIYEFAFKNLKQWAKLKNVFDKIDWSEEPEQIFKKAEKLKNEIN